MLPQAAHQPVPPLLLLAGVQGRARLPPGDETSKVGVMQGCAKLIAMQQSRVGRHWRDAGSEHAKAPPPEVDAGRARGVCLNGARQVQLAKGRSQSERLFKKLSVARTNNRGSLRPH